MRATLQHKKTLPYFKEKGASLFLCDTLEIMEIFPLESVDLILTADFHAIQESASL
jgi:hypothetical protein